MYWILTNLFWIGLGIVILTLILSQQFLSTARYRPSSAKKINIAYATGFFIMIYGWGIITMDFGFNSGWIETGGYILLGLLGLGALLENRRDLPLAKKELQTLLEQLKQDDPDKYYEFMIQIESDGADEAFQKLSGE
tara:strand:+ start:264 stop:674 length:411 start_codon:yes stop_codon:yes gene_type:complete